MGVTDAALGQIEHMFDVTQDAAEIMDVGRNLASLRCGAGNIALLCISRHNQQRHSKSVDVEFAVVVSTVRVARATWTARSGRRRDVIVKPSPIIPCNQDDGIRPVIARSSTRSDGIYDRRRPRRPAIASNRTGVVRP